METIETSIQNLNKSYENWPWNVQIPQFSNTFSDSTSWPKISIVTPSFNQAKFIEETIRSVICQGYPNLEYIIIDGGSTDGSVEIIKKYEEYLTYWVSEPDRGQAHAINKGISRITGDIFGWINSDDLLIQGSLKSVAFFHMRNKKSILLGNVIHFSNNPNFTKIYRQKNITFNNVALIPGSKAIWQQPGTFIPVNLIDNNEMDESFRYVFDQDWFCRILLQNPKVEYLTIPIAMFRYHENSKTVSENESWTEEIMRVISRYWDQVPNVNKKKVEALILLNSASNNLRIGSWNRKQGIFYLGEAVKKYKLIIFNLRFIVHVLKVLLSIKLLKFFHSFFQKFRNDTSS